jgi:hypothetical protein
VLFVVRTEEDRARVAEIVAGLNLEREQFVVISFEAPDAEAARERNKAMRIELEQLRARLKELEGT